jgi:hypothetical protein
MSFPNPQLVADAHKMNVFSMAVFQAAVKIINHLDEQSAECQAFRAYFHENVSKLESCIEELKANIG